MTLFIQTQKQKKLSMTVTLNRYLNQSILHLYQTYENLEEKFQARLFIQSLVTLLVFQNIIL